MANTEEPADTSATPGPEHDAGSDTCTCGTALTELIDRYLKRYGLSAPHVVLTDVLIVASHRGFSSEGTTTATSVVCPTESSVATLLGLTQYASIFYGNTAARSMQAGAQ